MNNLKIFENEEFGSIRTMLIDEAVWFVGKDVAIALGYINASKAVINHVDEDDKNFVMIDIADSQTGMCRLDKAEQPSSTKADYTP